MIRRRWLFFALRILNRPVCGARQRCSTLIEKCFIRLTADEATWKNSNNWRVLLGRLILLRPLWQDIFELGQSFIRANRTEYCYYAYERYRVDSVYIRDDYFESTVPKLDTLLVNFF